MRYFFLLLWLLLGVFYWQSSQGDCCDKSTSDVGEKVIPPIAPVDKVETKRIGPISFKCQKDEAVLTNAWESFRDSLVGSMGDNESLEIRGFEFSDESGNDLTLALRRATNVRKLFSLPENRIRLGSGTKGEKCSDAQLSDMIAFNVFRNSKKIKETKDGTTIYFNSNSTNKLDDAEVEAYLDDVAARVKESGERIRLTGHTDSLGEEVDNFQLGLARANVIKTYLVSQGVRSSQILAGSKGELAPISSNSNADGRQQNRRTELKIFK